MTLDSLQGSSSLTPPKQQVGLDRPLIHAEELAERDKTKLLVTLLAQESFYAYVRLMGPVVVPGFKDGKHIQLICEAIQEAYETDNARLMVFLPPGSSKSIIGSLLFPSWIFGKHPEWQILHIAHTFDFIATFGGKIRDLLQSPEYLAIFPHVKLNDKYQAREYWETMQQGVYRCAGAGSAIAGKRGHIGITDDLVSEQTYKSPAELEKIYNWWAQGFESRLLDGGRIIVINTRWGLNDIAGWLLERAKNEPGLDQWKVISIPAILNEEAAELLGLPIGESYWPEVWRTETLLKKKKGMPASQWLALYQQSPIALDGNIIKVENFKIWKDTANPPDFKIIIASLDTAFSIKAAADYSVIQLWGVFDELRTDSQGYTHKVPCAMILKEVKGRWEYPDLVAKCADVKFEYDPDVWIIEQKGSGLSLIQDLRRRGYFIHAFNPGKGDDKVSRVHVCTPFIDDGRVYLPKANWCQDLKDCCAAFPKGRHDDSVDAMSGAIIYLRDSFYLNYDTDFSDDEDDEDKVPSSKKFYW